MDAEYRSICELDESDMPSRYRGGGENSMSSERKHERNSGTGLLIDTSAGKHQQKQAIQMYGPKGGPNSSSTRMHDTVSHLRVLNDREALSK